MTTFEHRRGLAATTILLSPLVASAGFVLRGAEAGTDAAGAWELLGAIAPLALWGLPLAYVVFSVLVALPRHPRAQDELAEPKDATLVDRLSLHRSSQDGW